MDPKIYDMPEGTDIAWCPGMRRLSHPEDAEGRACRTRYPPPAKLAMVSGIGQAAKIPHYLKCNLYNGLHGRALPPATAIKAVNPGLTVIAESGDGDMYGEGGNHFMHCIRRNPNITNIVHDNMVYGLTKGQASPTSQCGFKTPVQVAGVILEPFNPLAVAIALGASFVARCFSGDFEQTKNILKQAIKHDGYALVDIFQPCVSFNKINTFKWFKENTYYLDDSHDPEDRNQAFTRALEQEKRPLGVFYINPRKTPFEELIPVRRENKVPLFRHEVDQEKVRELVVKLGA